MNLRTLRAFVEVVRQGGFSQAAEVVSLTQSSVSKAVKTLEDELGTPLLNRLGHRNELTAAGEVRDDDKKNFVLKNLSLLSLRQFFFRLLIKKG